jgi:hypothetical protein
MKKLVFLSVILLCYTTAKPQFVNKPISFPGQNYWAFFMSAADTSTVWVGVDNLNGGSNYGSYSNAISSTDGGNTWNFFPLADTGTVIICNVCAINANTCFYVNWNGNGNIWKTSDGGATWIRKTTTQYIGGWADFYHAFSADTGIVVGDPHGGYWEIYLTSDGGDTWTRVPSANIPAIISGEYGFSSQYSAIGNLVWFASNKGRCFKSVDKGLHWTVKALTGTWLEPNVCFIDSLRGVFWEPTDIFKKSTETYNNYYATTDGGLTWTQKSLPQHYAIQCFSRIPGVDGGMIVAAFDSSHNDYTTVLFSSDFFNTFRVVQTGLSSDGKGDFLNSKSGWLSGNGNRNSSIYKLTTNLISGIAGPAGNQVQLQVYPNPSSAEAILKIPSPKSQTTMTMRITDITGKEMENRRIMMLSPYIQLNAAKYTNGIYIIWLTLDGGESAVCRWVVCH